MKMNKYNSLSGKGEELKLFERQVYNIEPNDIGEFWDTISKKCLAKRVELELTQDKVYKTQFYNPNIAFALQPINEATKVLYYYEGDTEPADDTITFSPEVNNAYSSIICKRQPAKNLKKVSLVVYCGPEVSDFLQKDGSVTMDPDYWPEKGTDVITKDYAENLIERISSIGYSLDTFEVVQSEVRNNISGFCYLDNSYWNRILLVKDTTGSCIITVNPFVISTTFSEENVSIGLCVNGVLFHSEKIKVILEGKSDEWSLVHSDNIYDKVISKVFWKNAYKLTLPSSEYTGRYTGDKPYLDISIKVFDNENLEHYKSSRVIKFGADDYIKKVEPDIEMNYVGEIFDNYKTEYVSGKKYFKDNPDISLVLPVTFKIKNNFLNYYRLENNLELSVQDKEGEVFFKKDLPIKQHFPLKDFFKIESDIRFNTRYNIVCVKAYNLLKEEVFKWYYKLDTKVNEGDESNRVTTPDASILFPEDNYGQPWNPEKPLEVWEPSLENDEYKLLDEYYKYKSAICFAVNPNDCYSHMNLDIEHDGELYIKVEGRTGWLSGQNIMKAFNVPTKNDEGCKMNEGYYSFGKVVYKERIFLRILKATFIRLKSIELK